MQVDSAPSTILTIQQLLWALQLVVVVLSTTTIGTAPVLDNVPIGAFATITRCDETLVATSGVETADDV